MIENLHAYLYGDPSPRRTRDRLSILIAFTGYVLGMAIGYSGVTLLAYSIVMLVACQVLTTVLFCWRKPTVSQADIASARMRLTAGASFAALAAILLLARPQVKGAVIEEQLRRISKEPDPDPKAFQRAQSLISTANSDGIVLPSSPIQEIVDRRLQKEDVFKAVVDKVNGEAAARGLPTPIIGFLIRKKTEIGTMTITGVSGEGFNPEPFEPPGPVNFAPPDMVAFIGPIGTTVTSPVLPGAGVISILGESENISIPLDNLHCKNAIFSECVLIYSGAALKLENVAFYKCRMNFANNVACQRFAAELLGRPSVSLS